MSTEKLKDINIYRVKEALEIRKKTLTDLSAEMKFTLATLYNRFNNGFTKAESEKLSEILGFSVDSLSRRLKG